MYINTLAFVFHGLPPPLADRDCHHRFNQQVSILQHSSLIAASEDGDVYLSPSSFFLSTFSFFFSLSSPNFFFPKHNVRQTKKSLVNALVSALFCLDKLEVATFKFAKLKFVRFLTLSGFCFKM